MGLRSRRAALEADLPWPRQGLHAVLLGAFVAGRFSGQMIVADLARGSVVCQARFGFRSGEKIRYRRRGPSSEATRVEQALADDFEERFAREAAASLDRLARRQLRLGLKWLE